MKLNIAVCDDHIEHVNMIEKYLDEFNFKNEVHLIKASSGEELLELSITRPIDIAFLDIEMKELNGIQVGRHIKARFPDVIIVFVTGFKDYALEAFDLNAFHYLIKPIIKEKFMYIMKSLLKRLQEIKLYKENTRLYTLKLNDATHQIVYHDIFYFEKMLRKIRIYTRNGDYNFYGSIKGLLAEIDNQFFIQCHQGYLVNRNQILRFEGGNLVLKEIAVRIPVSRKYKSNVIGFFESTLF